MAEPTDPLTIFCCSDCEHVFEYCEARRERCPKCDSQDIFNAEEVEVG